MTQGTESCHGYDIDYDPAYEGLASGKWDDNVRIEDMSNIHLQNALKVSMRASQCAAFSCDEEKWEVWAEILSEEIAHRKRNNIVIKSGSDYRVSRKKGTGKRGLKSKKKRVEYYQSIDFKSVNAAMECHCGKQYTARVADLRRGWATSCSKRCAAIRREYGRPCATLIEEE